MPKKVSFYMIVALLDLVLKGVRAAIRALQVIRDLLDDGKLNESADLPQWLSEIDSALQVAEGIISDARTAFSGSDDSELVGHA